jgi:UPF0042 nucleotide-binding protein
MLVVVVTGLSGAGKSTAIDALEDLGFFCVDNLPTPVVASTLEACARGGMQRVALGIDVRVRSFLDEVGSAIDAVADDRHQLVVVFLDALDEVLLRRYSSTRRPHPLTACGGEGGPSRVLDGIRLERGRLVALRARANLVVDTTLLSVHELRQRIVSHFVPPSGQQPRMRIRFVSFGFTRGVPVDADLVFDVRFMPNPFFVEALSPLSGQNREVQAYLTREEDCQGFLRRTQDLLEFLIPRFEQEGKAYLTVAFGCTGGRHRSVAVAELLGNALRTGGHTIEISHRDVRAAEADTFGTRVSEGVRG